MWTKREQHYRRGFVWTKRHWRRRDSNTIGEGGQRDSDTRRGLCGQRDSDTVGESLCGQRDSNSVGEGLCRQRDSNSVGEEKAFNQVCTEKDLNETVSPLLAALNCCGWVK